MFKPDAPAAIGRTALVWTPGPDILPPDDQAAYGMALKFIDMGSPAAALERLSGDDHPYAKFLTALIYQKTDCFTEAASLYRHLLSAAYQAPEIHINLGACLLAMFASTGKGEPKNQTLAEMAVEQFEAATAAQPDLPLAHFLLGHARMIVDANGAACEAFQAVLQADPNFSPALTGLADACIKLKDRTGAETALNRVVALEPGNAPAWARLLDIADKDEQNDLCRRVLDACLPNLAPEALALTGRIEEALERAPSAEPLRPEYWAALANAHLARGEAEAAASAFVTLLDREFDVSPSPDFDRFVLAEGLFAACLKAGQHHLDNGDAERAVVLATAALKLSPLDAPAYALIETALEKLSGADKAAKRNLPHAPCLPPHHSILTTVWGEAFCCYFADTCLPSLLADGNLPALSRRLPLRYVIATTEKDWNRLKKAPAIKQLERLADVVFQTISPRELAEDSAYMITENAAKQFIASCQELESGMTFLPPDVVAGNGTLKVIVKGMERGMRAVLGYTFIADEPGFRALIEGARMDQVAETGDPTTFPIASRDLLKLAFQVPHAIMDRVRWDFEKCTDWPYAMAWKAAPDSYIVRHMHTALLYVYPTDWSAPFSGTVDREMVARKVEDPNLVYICTDSDEAILVDVSPTNKNEPAPGTHPANPYDLARWIATNHPQGAWHYFDSPVWIHSDDKRSSDEAAAHQSRLFAGAARVLLRTKWRA